ncbi:50S ribosomal protein L4 [bacterium]|nr:50S ribosomal protein L4 [bacterium]
MENNEQIKQAVFKKVQRPIVVVDDLAIINEPKAELLEDTLNKLKVEGKALIVIDEETAKNSNLIEAAEKSKNARLILITDMASKDVLEADCLVITRAAMTEVSERLSQL